MAVIHASSHPCAAPFIEAFLASEEGRGHSVAVINERDAEWNLLEGECDAALVSPFAYARNQTELALIEGVGVAAVGPTAGTMLYFKPGLRQFSSIAVSGDLPMDVTLAQIVLREKYKITPKFSSMNAPPDVLLEANESVLTDAALRSLHSPPSSNMDIVEEWFDLVELPFVRLVLVGWRDRMTDELEQTALKACRAADVRATSSLVNKTDGRFIMEAHQQIPGHYRYVLDEESYEAMTLFFRYAFFYGLHRDIPDLHFRVEES